MKKTQKWFYSLAAAALIFSGCSAKAAGKTGRRGDDGWNVYRNIQRLRRGNGSQRNG